MSHENEFIRKSVSTPSQNRSSSRLEEIAVLGNLYFLQNAISSPRIDEELSSNFVRYVVWHRHYINFGDLDIVPPQTISQVIVTGPYQRYDPLANLKFSNSFAYLQNMARTQPKTSQAIKSVEQCLEGMFIPLRHH